MEFPGLFDPLLFPMLPILTTHANQPVPTANAVLKSHTSSDGCRTINTGSLTNGMVSVSFRGVRSDFAILHSIKRLTEAAVMRRSPVTGLDLYGYMPTNRLMGIPYEAFSTGAVLTSKNMTQSGNESTQKKGISLAKPPVGGSLRLIARRSDFRQAGAEELPRVWGKVWPGPGCGGRESAQWTWALVEEETSSNSKKQKPPHASAVLFGGLSMVPAIRLLRF